MASFAGFVDAGFLKAAGAKAVGSSTRRAKVQASQVIDWLSHGADGRVPDTYEFLRCYWYDGAFNPGDARWESQHRYFDALARTPGLHLRLGHIVERKPTWQRPLEIALRKCGVDLEEFKQHFEMRAELSQKGVDALITLDLVRLAQRGAYSTAILLAGDRDLAEAVRTAQDSGCRVVLAYPQGAGVASELRQIADDLVVIPRETLATWFEIRELQPAQQPDEAEQVEEEALAPQYGSDLSSDSRSG